MYEFNDKNLLLEALTHESYISYLKNNNMDEKADSHSTYEKLEVLGDALLDTIVNSNMIDYAF